MGIRTGRVLADGPVGARVAEASGALRMDGPDLAVRVVVLRVAEPVEAV